MRIAGVVAEYNPFHNGHAYHLEKTRLDSACEATHIVAVMSGSFVQRGEPAIMPKFDRARAALAGGADLVLELPVPWCLSSMKEYMREKGITELANATYGVPITFSLPEGVAVKGNRTISVNVRIRKSE